ncbi:MAG: NAD(P)/FAD-dependent oxidoreductase [Solobacterium sp.]|nr:NAD(P)/FAD-dependent oxidoreductase [Solobacterium sp.]
MSDLYDIAIIGTGPGGLEAAITAKIRNKNILVLGSPESSLKVQKAHEIGNYLGLPAISGEQMQKTFLDHAKSMGVEITDDRAVAVYDFGDYFAIQTRDGNYNASSIILATGVVAAKPYPGEERLLGRGVSYCATCDAPLYRDKTAIVIASSPSEEAEADFMSEYAAKVYYIPLYKEEAHVREGIEVLRVKPVEIVGENKVEKLVTDQDEITADGVFILREAVAPGQLVPGLETDGPHVKVNLDMSTSLPGVFACGDIAGLPYQYIKAAGQGNTAALSAVNYLAAKERLKNQQG